MKLSRIKKLSWKLLCLLICGLAVSSALPVGATNRQCPAGCASQAVACLKVGRLAKACCRMIIL